jgi:poly(ADP-ribose) glycohydrolase ARH3
MRVAPVGLLFSHDLDEVAKQARESAWPTHRHELGIEGAVLLAVGVAIAAKGPPLNRKGFIKQLKHYCHTEEFGWQLEALGKLKNSDGLAFLGNSLPAHRSVGTALGCFLASSGSFEHAMAKAIALGDTLGAMTGALIGAHLGVEAIPQKWLDAIERRQVLEELARGLWARIESHKSSHQPQKPSLNH